MVILSGRVGETSTSMKEDVVVKGKEVNRCYSIC